MCIEIVRPENDERRIDTITARRKANGTPSKMDDVDNDDGGSTSSACLQATFGLVFEVVGLLLKSVACQTISTCPRFWEQRQKSPAEVQHLLPWNCLVHASNDGNTPPPKWSDYSRGILPAFV
jgi:hypothetical protein